MSLARPLPRSVAHSATLNKVKNESYLSCRIFKAALDIANISMYRDEIGFACVLQVEWNMMRVFFSRDVMI